MQITKAVPQHLDAWAALRHELWGGDLATLQSEAEGLLANENEIAFLLFDGARRCVGFIEGALYQDGPRNYGYVEGWYVEPEYRGQGHGRQLLDHLEHWVLHHAIDVLLSDTIPAEFPLSPPAHLRNGFEEFASLQIFIKNLKDQP